MNGNLVAIIILIIIAMVFVGWLIYQTGKTGERVSEIVSLPVLSEDKEKESATVIADGKESATESRKPLPDTSWLLDSLKRFTAEEDASETATATGVKKYIGSVTISPIFSPFTKRFGFSSTFSLYGITLGVTYADDLYVGVGYTFRF